MVHQSMFLMVVGSGIRDKRMHSDVVERFLLDNKLWFKIRDDDAFESIHDGFKDYMAVWNDAVKTKGVVVQAGGYCGVFPRLLSETFDRVYTFEPDPLNFFCLTLNCQTDNVVKAQAALYSSHSLINVRRTNAHNKGMNVIEHSAGSFIPSYRIDDLQLDRCDLIALDVEGCEHAILEGAIDTIYQHKPVVTVEDTNEKIVYLLSKVGYKEIAKVHRDTVYST